jgi:hypothetical protein
LKLELAKKQREAPLEKSEVFGRRLKSRNSHKFFVLCQRAIDDQNIGEAGKVVVKA